MSVGLEWHFRTRFIAHNLYHNHKKEVSVSIVTNKLETHSDGGRFTKTFWILNSDLVLESVPCYQWTQMTSFICSHDVIAQRTWCHQLALMTSLSGICDVIFSARLLELDLESASQAFTMLLTFLKTNSTLYC